MYISEHVERCALVLLLCWLRLLLWLLVEVERTLTWACSSSKVELVVIHLWLLLSCLKSLIVIALMLLSHAHIEGILAAKSSWLLLLHGAILTIVWGLLLLLVAIIIAHLIWHLSMELLAILLLLLIIIILLLLIALYRLLRKHGIRLELRLLLLWLLATCRVFLIHWVRKCRRRERIRTAGTGLDVGGRYLNILLRCIETEVESSILGLLSLRILSEEVVLIIVLGGGRLRRSWLGSAKVIKQIYQVAFLFCWS